MMQILRNLIPSLFYLGALVLVLLVALRVSTRGLRRVADRLIAEDATRREEIERWLKQLTGFIRLGIELVAVILVAFILLRGFGIKVLPGLTGAAVLTWLASSGLRIAFILAIAYALVRLFRIVLLRLEQRVRPTGPVPVASEQEKRARTLTRLLGAVFATVVWSIAALMVLRELGVNITPILTGAGIIGLAVGFGAQHLVRDVISGFFLILEDQVRVGDVAIINGTGGLVEAIRLRTIVLRGLDGTVHVFPNGSINTLANMTKDFSYYVIDLGVAYKEDVDHVMDVLRQVGAELRADPKYAALILDDLEILGVDAFADSAVVIKLRIKTLPLKQWEVGRELRRRVKNTFDACGIEIPYPHLTVYTGEASKPFPIQVAEAFASKQPVAQKASRAKS